MPDLREAHVTKHAQRARNTFANHVITKESDRRWLLQQIHADGKPDWTLAAEIICLENNAIYFGGDWDSIVFAYGPQDPISRLLWIGRCTDIDYYVAQKAKVGIRGASSDVWDSDVATEGLKFFLEEQVKDGYDKDDSSKFDQYWFESACSAEYQHEYVDYVHRAFPGLDYDTVVEGTYNLGEVVAPAVITAHAAIAKLCDLLKEREPKNVDKT